MPKKTSEPVATQQWGGPPPALVPATCNDITPADAPVGAGNSNPVTNERTTEAPQQADSPPTQDTSTKHRAVSRGLAASISTKLLKDRIWTGALLMANRFRVIRTIDVAMLFPERNFKASLTAAQRAVRGLVKAQLLKRYRSDRFQHYCGISKRGVDWLEEAGFEASSSVRRASDMTNPEHRLWAQFWTLACEARGLSAMTEQELLRHLNKDVLFGQPLVQGYLTVATMRGKVSRQIQLRPDAICREPDDGSTTWCETDLSLRGAQRLSSLHALCSSVGRSLKDSTVLRNVVVFCKTERIQKRALNVLSELATANNAEVLVAGRRHFRAIDHGTYAVWMAVEKHLEDGRTQLVDTLTGHIFVQLLPIWLPKVRIDASNTHSMEGWFDDNYLPYRKPPGAPGWSKPTSPLLTAIKPR